MTAVTTPTKPPRLQRLQLQRKAPERASLQLTHELGGYIRRMRSRAPTENLKNTSNTKTHRLSLSATPQLPLRLEGY
jgi:hypothetical protein